MSTTTRTTPSNDEEPDGRSSAGRTWTGRRILIRGGVLVALLGAVTAAYLFVAGRFPGDSMAVAWSTPADPREGDRPADAGGYGDWLAGDTFVRSRPDAATGHDAGTGRQVWEYRPAGNSAICAAEADAAQAVLVVTRDDEKRPASDKRQSCTTLAAIDMTNGREIWRTPVPARSRERRLSDYGRAPVTAGGALAVLTHQGLRAVDVRTGTPRWTAAVPPDCVPAHALPAVRHVAALLACGGPRKEPDAIPKEAELHAAAFDPATGALLWSTPVGDREPAVWGETGAYLVSADPLVVDDVSAFHSFGRDGRPNPPIDSRGISGSSLAVDDTRLYALDGRYVKKVGARENAVAFDLATGKQVWKTDLDSEGKAFHLQDGRLTVVGERRDMMLVPAVRLYLLDAATGRERDVRHLPYGEAPTGRAFEYEGLTIVDGTAYARS